MSDASPNLLSARVTVHYPGKAPVLRDVALDIAPGEVLGLVGQSGSGKSTLALAILGLLSRKRATVEGTIVFQGADLLRMKERDLRSLRGRSLSLVLQSPLSSLNPALRIRTQLKEAWRAHAATGANCDAAIQSAMTSVSLPADPDFLRKYPSQLSVGQAQRVLIAMAVMHRPALLVADEATSALDVITQSEILELFAQLNRTIGMSILYISHDLPSVAGLCRRIAILHEGQIVENGPTDQIFTAPAHEYTRRLMASLPRVPTSIQETLAKARAASAGVSPARPGSHYVSH
ncbi:MAG TPA: ABC transporter ATP-binding protein [Terriglobales bacterium]|jgi:ABC-type dipeptide/oligopeptide/nickel transport system ATPase component|nr:ABC transporter ATP-binding protein [Terriglobales bacterium]